MIILDGFFQFCGTGDIKLIINKQITSCLHPLFSSSPFKEVRFASLVKTSLYEEIKIKSSVYGNHCEDNLQRNAHNIIHINDINGEITRFTTVPCNPNNTSNKYKEKRTYFGLSNSIHTLYGHTPL